MECLRSRGKRSLAKLRYRWEGNIRIDFKEMGFDARNFINTDRIGIIGGSLVNAPLNLQVPQTI